MYKLETDSCLKAILRVTGRRGKPNTTIGKNEIIFFGAERKIAQYFLTWKEKRVEDHLFHQKYETEDPPIRSPSFCRFMAKDWLEVTRKQFIRVG